MIRRFNRFFALLTVVIMTITIAGGNLFNSNTRVLAKEGTSQRATVNDVIKLLTNELSKKGNAADKDEKIALYKAGVTSIDKASVIKELAPKYGASFGSTVSMAAGIMGLDEDPSTYDGKDLIKEIVDKISKLKLDEKTSFWIMETEAIALLDRFNDKYPDKKVDYNTENAIKYLIADLNNQLNNKKSSLNTPQNLALGLKVFLKHTDVDGVQGAVTNCKKLLHDWQIDDGSVSSLNKYSAGQHSPAVQKLAEAGEKLDSTEWTKGDKNAIDALFNSWDGKQFNSKYGKDNSAYKNVLNALLSLKVAGYGEYEIKGANFDSAVREVPKKSCNVRVRVEANDHTIVPLTELTADNFDLSPYGGNQLDKIMAVNGIIKALENSGIDCKKKSKFDKYNNITNINGLKTGSTGENDGWMYYINNKFVPVGISEKEIEDGNSIVVFFQEDYNKIIYSWFDQENVNIKTGEKLTLNLNGTHSDMNTNETVKSAVNGAKILVGNTAMIVGGKNVLTDKDGNAVLKFDKPGTYTISAERFDSQTKKRDITRPYCKVVVEQGQANTINKEALEKYINEAQDLVKNATIGNEVGQYTKESVNKLKAEIDTANELMKKSEVTQEEIDSEATKLQGSINTFKESVNKNKDIKSAINEVLGYYNGWIDNNYKSFDYIPTLALRRAGMDTDTLNKKINIYGMESLHNNARNVMTLIGSNNNPKNYKNKNYVSYLEKYDLKNEKDSEYIAKAITALDMSKANYDKENIVKLLLSKAHDEGNGKISFGSVQISDYDDDSEEYQANITATCWTLIALSNHKDMDKCSSIIDGIKKYLKENQKENGLIDNCTNTALLTQGLIALGENPLNDYWCVKNDNGKITLADAILKCKDKNVFGESPSSNIMGDYATPHALAALTDLNLNSSMFKELSFNNVGSPVKLSIDGEKVINLYKGQFADTTAKAYDCNNLVVKDAAIVWKSSDENVVTVKNGTLTASSEGQAEITAYISGNQSVKDTITVKVTVPPVKDYTGVIKNEIDFLKDHYKAYGSYEFLASPAAVIAGMDKKEIGSKIQGHKIYNTALNCSRMAISILGAGLEPRNYVQKDKTVNFIEILEKAQQTEGLDKGKFIVNQSMDKDSIETQAYTIIALDLAGSNYNKKDAVSALLSLLNDASYKNKNSYKSIKTEAIAVTALAKHKDINGVQSKIDELLQFIKYNQNKDGGFDIAAGSTFVNSPVATSAVVTALYANDIDPLSIEWSKDGKSIIDGMLKGKFIGNDSSKSGYAQGEGTGFENYEATYYAFAAFTELQNKKCIFDMINANNEAEKQSNTIKIEGNKTIEIYKGQEINFIAKVYDENNAVVEKAPISWKSSNDKVACINTEYIKGISEGEVEITAYMTDNEKVKDNIRIKVINPSKVGYNNVIKNEIDFLKEHYKPYGSYEFLASPAAVIAGMDKNEIGSKILRYSSNNVAIYDARVIVALLGAGLDPRNDVVNGTKNNYVEILEKAQKTEGNDKGKFVINEFADSDAIVTQSYCIIALDLAEGNYDKESAVKSVLAMLNDKNYKNAASYHSVETEAVALMALAKHKDVEGAESKIDELLQFIKSNQNNDGGFDIAAGSTFVNSPIATGAVVTALYTLGIDPMSAEWTKNGNTVIDGIVRSKIVKNDPAIGGYAQGEELNFENYKSTYYTFATFVQLQNKKSIFDMMDKVNSNVKVDKVTINKEELKLKEGQVEKLTATILPEDTTNKKVKWTSSNEKVVTVDENGNVKAIAEGDATIKVTIEDVTKSAECKVKVTKPQIIDKKLKIENITNQTQFNKNSKAKVTIRVTNTSESNENATLIVGLFDKNGKLINFVVGMQNIKSGKTSDLTGMIKTPNSDLNVIKVFVWDSLDNMNSLYDTIVIPVK